MTRRTLLLVAVLAGVGVGCTSRRESPQRVELTYYYLKYCTFCQGVKAAVEAMPAKYPNGLLTVKTIEHLDPGAPEAIKALGFKSHGLVMKVGEDIVFRQPEHRVDVGQVQLALNRLLPPEQLAVGTREH